MVESVVSAGTDCGCRPLSGERDPYPDHWKQFTPPWPAARDVDPVALKDALAVLPDPWRRVVILRDVEGRSATEVSAATGLSAEQQRDMLNRARELLREHIGGALERDSHRS